MRRDGGAQAPAPSVTVQSGQQIDPLDVVTLTSGDATVLTQWLRHNGFPARPGLATAAKPYIEQGWTFVAVRLRLDARTRFDGRLAPSAITDDIHFRTAPSDDFLGTAPETTAAGETSGPDKTSSNLGLLVGLTAAIVVVGLLVGLVVRRRPPIAG